jgi:hypothetical protein
MRTAGTIFRLGATPGRTRPEAELRVLLNVGTAARHRQPQRRRLYGCPLHGWLLQQGRHGHERRCGHRRAGSPGTAFPESNTIHEHECNTMHEAGGAAPRWCALSCRGGVALPAGRTHPCPSHSAAVPRWRPGWGQVSWLSVSGRGRGSGPGARPATRRRRGAVRNIRAATVRERFPPRTGRSVTVAARILRAVAPRPTRSAPLGSGGLHLRRRAGRHPLREPFRPGREG